MAKASALMSSRTQRVLLYGPPKGGKTQLAAEMANYFRKVWYFGLENGHETILKMPQHLLDKFEFVNIYDTPGLPIAVRTMLKVVDGKPYKVCDAHGAIGCTICMKNPDHATYTEVNMSAIQPDELVIIDSATQLVSSVMSQIGINQDIDYKFQHDDWGEVGKYMGKFFGYIQNARYNVIVISHEAEVEMEDGKFKLVPVGGTRNFSRGTARYFDHVVYCEVKAKQHKAGSATDYALNVMTGSRSDVKLESLQKVSLAAIFGFEPGAPAPMPTSEQAQNAVAADKLKNLLNKTKT